MPWTIKDVDKHKKGLTGPEKKQWVRIANSARAKCLADGGTESSCDASAIRQANGVIGHSNTIANAQSTVRVETGDYVVRHEMHQGKAYIVVPVVMMREGVHNGSRGPTLHLAEELGNTPESWNGMPVIIDHPSVDGEYVSANSPEIIETRSVGRVYNAHMDNDKLRAELWLNEDRLRQLSPVALDHVNRQLPLDVSVGIYSDNEEATGEWNGEEYHAIARNYRKDHLALLPGGVGACSWNDGCGIRANKKGGNQVDTNEQLKEACIKAIIENNADRGFQELVQAVRNKIDSLDSESVVHYLQEVYDDAIVYEVRMRVGGTRLYKQTYTFNNGMVELTGDPIEVVREVKYAVASHTGMTRLNYDKFKNKKEVNTMSDKVCTPCVKERVDNLIANKLTKYSENDREWLQTLAEDQLDKMVPEKVAPTVQSISKEQVMEVMKSMKPEERTLFLTADQQAVFAYGQKQMKERRDNLIKGIQDNTGKEIWPDETLSPMDEDMLVRIFNSVKKEEVADYSGLSVGRAEKPDGIEPLLPVFEPEKHDK